MRNVGNIILGFGVLINEEGLFIVDIMIRDERCPIDKDENKDNMTPAEPESKDDKVVAEPEDKVDLGSGESEVNPDKTAGRT